MVEKRKIINILLIASLILALLPFYVSFQDLLTNIVMKVNLYKALQNTIVPYEMKVVGGIINLLRFPISAGSSYFSWNIANGKKEAVYLAWNCIGWQTMILFLVTLVTGFSKRHLLSSKIEAILIGALGTYIINIVRITVVILIYFWFGRGFGIIFHDYFSSLITIFWLIGYWLFVYKHTLIEKSVEE